MIKVVQTENFRGYANKNNEIKFKPGINLVLGDNATGKSTIVTSILFNLLHKKIDVVKFEDYRTIEPKDLQNFKSGVTITSMDGKEYTIERILQGDNLRIKIKCDGEELKKSGELELNRQKDAQRFILDKFGVREEILEDILVQIQEPVKLLWPVREATEVGKELSKLLRLESLQNIYTNAKSAGKLLKEKANIWEKEIKNTEEQIKKLGLQPPEEYEKQKDGLENEKEKFNKEIEQFRSKLIELKGEKTIKDEMLGKLKEKAGKLKGNVEKIEKIKLWLKDKKKSKKSSKKLKAGKERLELDERKLREKIANYKSKIGGLETSKKENSEQKKKVLAKIDPLSDKYASFIQRIQKYGIDNKIDSTKQSQRLTKLKQSEYQKLERIIGGLTKQIATDKQYTNILSKAKAKCPICDAKLTATQRRAILKEKQKSIEELKRLIKEEKGKSETTKKIIDLLDEIKSVLSQLTNFTSQLSEANERIEVAEKKLPRLLEKQQTLETQLSKIENNITLIDEHIKIAEKFEEIHGLDVESEKLKRELKIAPELNEKVKAIETEIGELQIKLGKKEGDNKVLNTKIDSIKQNLKISVEWYSNLCMLRKKAKLSFEMAEEVQLASEAARLSLHEIFTNYSDIINTNLSWIWPRLYSRPDLKNIRLNVEIKEVEENEEKTLVPEIQLVRIGIGQEKIPFNTISSHGQRVLASIAFRIAFLNLLWRTSVPRILILDEPTIWIDDKNRERLGQLLASLVKEIKEGGIKIEQVIIISHDPVFLNAVDPEGVKHMCIKNQEGFCEIATTEE